MSTFNPITRIIQGQKLPKIYHQNACLGDVILAKFFSFPNKVIQVSDDDGIKLTCRDFSRMMTNIAGNLRQFGFNEGDTVIGLIANSTTFAAPLIFGCFLLHLPINVLDVSFSVQQIVDIYRETMPKIIFIDHNVADKVITALHILQLEARIVTITEKVDGLWHISDFLVEIDTSIYDIEFNSRNSSEVCASILCTSGSSGKPKLACISHAQYLENFSINEYNENDIMLTFCSLYWMTGFSQVIFSALKLQKRLVTSKPFSTDTCFNLIEKHQVSNVFLLPPHVALFVESRRFENSDLSSLKYFTTGGLFISEHLRRKLQSRLANGHVVVAYGMTEVGGIITSTDKRDPISSTVGRVTVNTEMKIVLDDGTLGGTNEIGEILVRKQGKFLGYFNSRHRSILDDEGWIHTGDMGFIDVDSKVHIVGQRPFVVKNFYHEIYPSELEEEIVNNVVGVESVCVVGVPDETEIEVPAAVVVRKSDSANTTTSLAVVSEDDIKSATSNLPVYKQIRDVFFVDSLPLSTNGKFQRNLIKDLAKEMKILNMKKINGL